LPNDQVLRQTLERLRALPQESVRQWAAVVSTENDLAAVSLARIDSLFKGELFQKELFDSALPPSKELVKAAKTKKK
jgi:hypothetical protein